MTGPKPLRLLAAASLPLAAALQGRAWFDGMASKRATEFAVPLAAPVPITVRD